MRKIIALFFVSSFLLVGLNGCGVKRPLYKKPDQQPKQQQEIKTETQFNS